MSEPTISLPLFYANLHCEERIHCQVCRGNRAWRADRCDHETPPDGKIDWSCPEDVAWPDGYVPTDDLVRIPKPPRNAPPAPHTPMPLWRDLLWWALPTFMAWWLYLRVWLMPGNVIARLARRAGFDKEADGGCSSCGGRQATLNGLGWWRCVLRPRRVWAEFGAGCAEWGVTRRAAIWRGMKGLLRRQPRVEKPESGGQT
jgi:hypothetical protein